MAAGRLPPNIIIFNILIFINTITEDSNFTQYPQGKVRKDRKAVLYSKDSKFSLVLVFVKDSNITTHKAYAI